jgi:hypothetical protein
MSAFDLLEMDLVQLGDLDWMREERYASWGELDALPMHEAPSPPRELIRSAPPRDPRRSLRASAAAVPAKPVTGAKLGDVCPTDLLREIMVCTGVEHPVKAMQLVRQKRCLSLGQLLQRRTGVCRTDGGAVVVRLLRREFPEIMEQGWTQRKRARACSPL